RVPERAVALERLGARRAARDDRAQLAPAGKPEVQRRADALRGRRQAVPGAVATEEHVALGGGADAVGDPVALVANRLDAEVAGQLDRRLLDLVVRVERADADAHLAARREAPGVARAHVAAVEP